MKKCAACKKEYSADYVFCPICGKKLQSSCPSCGKSLPEDANFCPYCGKSLKTRPAPADPKPCPQPAAPAINSRKLEKHSIRAYCTPMSPKEKDYVLDYVKGGISDEWGYWKHRLQAAEACLKNGFLVLHHTHTITGYRALDDGDTWDAGEQSHSLYVAKMTKVQANRFLQENGSRIQKTDRTYGAIITFLERANHRYATRYGMPNDPEKPCPNENTYLSLAENFLHPGDVFLCACTYWNDGHPELDMIEFICE